MQYCIFFLFFLFFSPSTGYAISSNGITVEEMLQVQKKTESYILDVRSYKEYTQAHIPNALWIDIENGNIKESLASLSTSASYIIYSNSDARSRIAINIITKHKPLSLSFLQGGIGSWKKAGYRFAKVP